MIHSMLIHIDGLGLGSRIELRKQQRREEKRV